MTDILLNFSVDVSMFIGKFKSYIWKSWYWRIYISWYILFCRKVFKSFWLHSDHEPTNWVNTIPWIETCGLFLLAQTSQSEIEEMHKHLCTPTREVGLTGGLTDGHLITTQAKTAQQTNTADVEHRGCFYLLLTFFGHTKAFWTLKVQESWI